MIYWHENLIPPTKTIHDAMMTIDHSALKIALVVDVHQRLLGTITDGDIRRAILHGVSFQSPVSEIMNKKFVAARESDSQEVRSEQIRMKQHRYLPVVNSEGQVVGLESMDALVRHAEEKENWVVLMAGGLGSRLRPLTDHVPKPLLNLGNKPLLETILDNFIQHGFRKFFLSVNYKSEMIENHFEDGSKWGVEIQYLREDKRMGTAGCLRLLPQKPEHPFIVMNGDLLTKIDCQQLLDFHIKSKAWGTMCVREFHHQLPYGVVKIDGHLIHAIDEKPVQKHFINAGIYVLDPNVIDLISDEDMFDMTMLFEKLVQNNKNAVVFPIREYWLDIGETSNLERARLDYLKEF